MVDSIISTASSGLQIAKNEIAITAHNVANVNTKDYSAMRVIQEAVVSSNLVQGVNLHSVTNQVDEGLQDALYTRISEDSYKSVISKYYDQMQDEFGKIGEMGSLDTSILEFFSALENLSTDPKSASFKQIAVQEAEQLANKVSSLAQSLENLRYNIDHEINRSITAFNEEIESAKDLSVSINSLIKGSIERLHSEEKLRVRLQNISEYFGIYKYHDSKGKLNVYTANGISLIGENLQKLSYTPQDSAQKFIDDTSLNAITANTINNKGEVVGIEAEVIPGGKSSEITTTLNSGKITALVKMRDTEIPNALAQLDNFAKKLKDEVNKIHNSGVAYLPPNKLLGSTSVSRDQILGFSGKTRIAIVDDNGAPVTNIPALTLDLGSLDTGAGAGKANVQGILQEIDYHFGDKLTSHNSVQLGNVNDIKLVSVSDAITPSGQLQLDLELENFSKDAATVQILSATAVDGSSNNILNTVDTASIHNLASGAAERTGMSGPSIVVNNPAVADYPYTITLNVRVNDGTTDYDSTITYTINAPSEDAFNGIKNQRFSATNATGAGTLNAAPFTSDILSTKMLDANGSYININDNTTGRVQLNTSSLSYHIAIDNLDSSHKGDPANNVLATNDTFSYFLGLNDMFARSDSPTNWGDTKNTAVNLAIRSDVVLNPNYISIGKLNQTINHVDPSVPLYTYEVSEGDNRAILELSNLTSSKVYFTTAGELPATTVTIGGYASNIIGYNATKAASAERIAEQAALVKDAIQEKLQNIKGVNINDELANLIIYQQSFTANAKLITASKEMSDILMNII